MKKYGAAVHCSNITGNTMEKNNEAVKCGSRSLSPSGLFTDYTSYTLTDKLNRRRRLIVTQLPVILSITHENRTVYKIPANKKQT